MYILNFSADLYDRKITVTFLPKICDE